ncbi:hypothetical protein F3I16_17550 [Pseudomonas sp. L-22-4S-12]|nr:hypothetical protein [Pseudomonas sp. L-22-4S-12]
MPSLLLARLAGQGAGFSLLSLILLRTGALRSLAGAALDNLFDYSVRYLCEQSNKRAECRTV